MTILMNEHRSIGYTTARICCYESQLLFTFATRLCGTSVAKMICMRMKQSVRGRDKIAALTNESRWQGVHFSDYTGTIQANSYFLES